MSCCMNWRRTDGGNERREEGIITITQAKLFMHFGFSQTYLSVVSNPSLEVQMIETWRPCMIVIRNLLST